MNTSGGKVGKKVSEGVLKERRATLDPAGPMQRVSTTITSYEKVLLDEASLLFVRSVASIIREAIVSFFDGEKELHLAAKARMRELKDKGENESEDL